jgi:hypothetical protein
MAGGYQDFLGHCLVHLLRQAQGKRWRCDGHDPDHTAQKNSIDRNSEEQDEIKHRAVEMHHQQRAEQVKPGDNFSFNIKGRVQQNMLHVCCLVHLQRQAQGEHWSSLDSHHFVFPMSEVAWALRCPRLLGYLLTERVTLWWVVSPGFNVVRE